MENSWRSSSFQILPIPFVGTRAAPTEEPSRVPKKTSRENLDFLFSGMERTVPECVRESHCSTVSTCIRATCNKPLIIYINTTSTCFQTGLRYTCTDQVFYFPHPFNVTSILEGKVLLLMHIYSRFVSYLADGALRICQQERSSNPFLASLWDFLVSPHSIQTADSRGLMTGDKQEII